MSAAPDHRVPRGPRPVAAIQELLFVDVLHTRDRARVLEVILSDADRHGHVDPNCVRSRLTGPDRRLTVTPQVLSAAYGSLCRKGILTRTGVVASTDRYGGNSGKYLGAYQLVDRAGLVALLCARPAAAAVPS